MIHALLALMACQLAGEAVTSALELPLPGPVLGMALLALVFLARPAAAEAMRSTAEGFLAHLSLLFVPAGVGVISQIAVLGSEAGVLMLAVLVSTALGIAAAALAFVVVARLVGLPDD